MKTLLCKLISVAFFIVAAPVSTRAAQAYPDQPIRLLVGFEPGGPTDVIARVLAKEMSLSLHQNMYVLNKPGASGMIAIREVKNARADGYTLLFSAPGLNLNPLLLGDQAGFDPMKDFAPISCAATMPMVIVTAYSSPFKTLPELLKKAATKPDAVSFASAGVGSPGQLAGELLAIQTKVKMLHVPSKGNGPALMEVISGREDFVFYPMIGIAENVAGHRLRVLAVATPKRMPQFPDAPTMTEAGFPAFKDTAPWVGLLAPAHTPKVVIDRLNATLLQALAKSSVKKQLEQLGAVTVGDSPDEFGGFLQRDYHRWQTVIAASGIHVNQ